MHKLTGKVQLKHTFHKSRFMKIADLPRPWRHAAMREYSTSQVFSSTPYDLKPCLAASSVCHHR